MSNMYILSLCFFNYAWTAIDLVRGCILFMFASLIFCLLFAHWNVPLSSQASKLPITILALHSIIWDSFHSFSSSCWFYCCSELRWLNFPFLVEFIRLIVRHLLLGLFQSSQVVLINCPLLRNIELFPLLYKHLFTYLNVFHICFFVKSPSACLTFRSLISFLNSLSHNPIWLTHLN